jgi:hypothetical protein
MINGKKPEDIQLLIHEKNIWEHVFQDHYVSEMPTL